MDVLNQYGMPMVTVLMKIILKLAIMMEEIAVEKMLTNNGVKNVNALIPILYQQQLRQNLMSHAKILCQNANARN